MHSQLLKWARRGGLLLAACSSCAAPEETGTRTQPVVDGAPAGDARGGVVYVMSEVGMLGNDMVVKIGSGTVVAPNLIATALHVTTKNPSNVPFTCDATGNEVSGSQGALLGALVEPGKISIYAGQTPDTLVAHGAAIVSSGSSTICKNDLAFVVLDQPLALPRVPIRRERAAKLGDDMTVVGYGGENVDPTLDAARTERDVKVTAIGQWIRTFTVSEGPCEGDSGGPALSPDGELVGVFSTVGVECRGAKAAAKFTDLSYFAPLIEEAFDAAGADPPWASPQAGSGGEAANGGESVASAGQATTAAGQPTVERDRQPDLDSGCCFSATAGSGAWPFWALCAVLGFGRVGKRKRAAPPSLRNSRKKLHESCRSSLKIRRVQPLSSAGRE